MKLRAGLKSFTGAGVLLGALTAATTASAQEAVAQCGGLDATIVKTEWTVEDFDASVEFEFESRTGILEGPFVLGTPDDDVIVVQLPSREDFNRWTNVHGADGNDTICLVGQTEGGVVAYGGKGDDVIFNNLEDSIGRIVTIVGGSGNDTLHGAPGGDLISGGDGNDQIFGYGGYNILAGEDGDDVLRGGRDVDLLVGGSGNDTMYGAQSSDMLYGGPGRDTLFGGGGADVLASNDDFAGSDSTDFEGFIGVGTFSLTTPSFSEDTAGSRMFGGSGTDLLIGSNRWDRMQGGAGDDMLIGMEGRDWMRGGPGNDTIIGGAGTDDINGNQGNDEIVFDRLDTLRGGFGIDRCLNEIDALATRPNACERSGPIDIYRLGLIEAS